MARAQEKKIIFTVGHSNRTIEEFIELLKSHGIEEIADVRSIPRSGYNPQFNETGLSLSLKKAGIAYRHVEKLGGLRHAKKDSVNLGWKNKSFRGYADYMGTQSFADGLDTLMKIAAAKKTAIMCAEAVPWRCHRSLISDALMKKKWRIEDITGKSRTHRHTLTPFLRLRGGKLVYPEIAGQQKLV